MNRRAFLKGAAIAASRPLSFVAGATRPTKVIIVGGGLAGLSCGYELRKLGIEVLILEGQGRPGGRVLTLREGLYPGLEAEAGATRIPDQHFLTLSYVQEFGLALEPFHGTGLADVVHLRGKNYTDRAGEPDWPVHLTAEERRLGRKGLIGRYLATPGKPGPGDERSLDVPESILALDRLTLHEYLQTRGLSPDAINLITLGITPGISAGLFFLIELNGDVSRGYYHIRGGNDQLPAALAERLGESVRYGSRVTAIGQDDNRAWAVVESADRHEVVSGDYVVSALPFSAARDIYADARLSHDKQQAVKTLQYYPVDKIFLQMRRQFWKLQGQSGFAGTDLLSQRFWALGPTAADERGLLLSYAVGEKAAQLDSMSAEDRAEATIADAEQVFPGARNNFEGYRLKSWSQDPWQQGGLLNFRPGELKLIPVSARREGRIFFAGEQTSRWNGWMQGAIESAQRVVKEISQRRQV